jgi:S-adenosylmethionine hydrolase
MNKNASISGAAGLSGTIDVNRAEINQLRADFVHEKELRDQTLSSEIKVLEARLDAKLATLGADNQNKLATLKSDIVALVSQKLQIIGAVGAVLGVMAFFGIPKYFELSLNDKIASFESKDKEILSALSSDDTKFKNLVTKASARSTIVVASDYGERDAYIEGIIGRLESTSPGLHTPQYIELPPGNPLAAAAKLSFIIKYFPKGTVIAALYNPDGTDNTQIISWLKNGKIFIGTNNGFSIAFIQALGGSDHAVRLERVPEVGQLHDPTLWGISRIGPAAAALASSEEALNPTDFGDALDLSFANPTSDKPKTVSGWVIAADRLGNCLTSISIKDLKDRFGSVGNLSLRVGSEPLTLPFIRNFADVTAHTSFAIDFDGVLNLAVESGSFPNIHPECKEGASITVDNGQ